MAEENVWTYVQHSGELFDPNAVLAEVGYSGAPGWVNKPVAERREDEGPIPTGDYYIEKAIDSDNLGPCAIALTPNEANQMHGRSGFYMHGDTDEMDQSASTGCIIMSRSTRDRVNGSSFKLLTVVAV